MNLQNSVMLVTGGAHRVGKAIALALASKGARVAFTYSASAEAANQTVLELKALGVDAIALHCDQVDDRQIDHAVQAVLEHYGRLDGLVNSASIFQEKSFFEITPRDWDLTLDINTRGPFFFMQKVARWMLVHSGGSIVNIIDDSAVRPGTFNPHHGASKAGLWILTRSLALALAPSIRVNAVLPGAVLIPPGWAAERWQNLADKTPLKRPGAPEDVSRAVVYLMEEEFITGQKIVVDGGSTLRC
jgi:NAD(P)-dependent dehydrogenase (short-subunit alcohol dehydrogenase family)